MATERPRRMVLKSFHVGRFRSLRDVTLSLEEDVTALVGRNDTGKSSLLDALRWYGRIATAGFVPVTAGELGPEEDPPPHFVALWRDAQTRDVFHHELVCDAREPRESLLVMPEGAECRWHPRSRRLECDAGHYDAPGMGRLASFGSASPAHWRSATDVPDSVIEMVATARRFATPTPYLFEPSAIALRVGPDEADVSRTGSGVLNLLQSIINRRDGTLDELEGAVRELFPFFSRVTVVEERWRVSREVLSVGDRVVEPVAGAARPVRGIVEAVAEQESERELRFEVRAPQGDLALPQLRWVPAAAVSSGILLALGYFSVVYAAPEGSLIALEEPENGLNRVITLEMMKQFLEVVRQRKHQLIMTTHNEFWLDFVGPERIRVVTRDDAGTHVSAAPDNMRKLQEEGFALSEVMAVGGPEQLIEPRRSRP